MTKEICRVLYNLSLIAMLLYMAYVCAEEFNNTFKSVLNGWCACFIFKWLEWTGERNRS